MSSRSRQLALALKEQRRTAENYTSLEVVRPRTGTATPEMFTKRRDSN